MCSSKCPNHEQNNENILARGYKRIPKQWSEAVSTDLHAFMPAAAWSAVLRVAAARRRAGSGQCSGPDPAGLNLADSRAMAVLEGQSRLTSSPPHTWPTSL